MKAFFTRFEAMDWKAVAPPVDAGSVDGGGSVRIVAAPFHDSHGVAAPELSPIPAASAAADQ